MVTPERSMLQVFQQTGLEGEHLFFQVNDEILKNRNHLNSINSLICSGEIPNIYSATELESLVKTLESQYNGETFDGNLVDYFCKSKSEL